MKFPLNIFSLILILLAPITSAENTTPELTQTPVTAPTADPDNQPEIIRKILERQPVVITKENANTATILPLKEEDLQKLPHAVWKHFGQDVGITPIMLATAFRDATTAQALVDAEANRWARTKKTKTTALAIACETQAYQVGKVLLKSPTADEFRIEIKLKEQRLRAYQNNVEIFSAAISTGRRSHPTPTGTFMITEKYGKQKISTLYDANMPFFMRLNQSATGIHAGELPGYPASHGCIRTPYAKAVELSKLVPLATQVVITTN